MDALKTHTHIAPLGLLPLGKQPKQMSVVSLPTFLQSVNMMYLR